MLTHRNALVPLFGALAALTAAAQQRTFVEPIPDRIQIGGQTFGNAVRSWKLGCIAGSESVDDATFQQAVADSKAIAAAMPRFGPVLQSSTAPLTGFDLQFTVNAPPAGALAAVAAVEAYYEARLGSTHATGPMLITINFGALAPTTGMSTATSLTPIATPTIVPLWIAGSDSDDVIPYFIPSASIPVRFDSTSATVTNCTSIFYAFSTIAGTIPGVAGLTGPYSTITVNTAFAWDYDPTNGITPGTACFQSALAHEVGHALGFNSDIELGQPNPVQLDVLRFQRSTGNPTSFANFPTTSRLVDLDSPNDDHELDLVNFEYAMEDGNPYQSSHFRDQSPEIGVMDPVLNVGATYWPNLLFTSDLRVLDALGFDWDDPGQVGLAHITALNRTDENPNSATLVRWQADFDKRVGPVGVGNFSVAGVAGSNVALVTPLAGNALHCDGTNWIDLQNFAPITTRGTSAFTAECWIKPNVQPGAGAPRRQFLSFGSNTVGQGLGLYLDSNSRVVAEVSGLAYIWSSPVVNDGNWHHVAFVSNGGGIASATLYVDGAAAGTNLITLNLQPGSCIAGRSLYGAANTFGFVGDVDEVRFWSSAIASGVLVNNSTHALPGSTAGLLGCFPFDTYGNLGFGNGTLNDTPQESLLGGFGEAGTSSAVQPTVVAGRVESAEHFRVEASVGAGSGTLTPTFTETDNVFEFRSGAPMNGPGNSTFNGQAYTILHASGNAYCEGSASCPCGNNTALGTNVGCLSSIGTGGKLRAVGSTSITAADLTLVGSQMPNSNALYLAGSAQAAGVLGDGLFCIGGTIVRLGTKANVSGGSQFPDLGQSPIATRVSATAGATSYFTIWYRNAAAFCTVDTFNDSNAWRVTWTP